MRGLLTTHANTNTRHSQGSYTSPSIHPVWACVMQREKGGGPWTGEDRKKNLLDHLKIQHPGGSALTPVFFCTKCRLEFNNFTTAGRHGRKCSGEANSVSFSLDLTLRSVEARSSFSSDRCSSVRRVFPVSEISGNKLILLYPGVPSQCPRCGWVTLASNCNAMHSMVRHLETKHSLRLVLEVLQVWVS